ncbi:dihydropteroate synthase [Desulfovibrio sp. JY]|nr:dihydropteroate synthase [Desulfovibrio sp. JY]
METNANTLWRLGRGLVLDCAANRIAGIINVTPDSFSDGGRHETAAAAVAHGLALAAEGADILDVGGESTRPGAAQVPLEEEIRRVVPVVSGILRELPGALVSVDTFKAGCAAAAIEAGAVIVNDISACAFDPELTDVLVVGKPGYVLMHCQGRPRSMQDDPRYDDVVEDILAFFEAHLSRLVRAGLPEDHVVLDPGIGFGKRLEHNLALLRGLDRFAVLGRPIYMGLSNKAFFGAFLGLPVENRGPATAVASALCAARGARIHRVHDVAGVAQALRLAAAMAA